MQLAIGDSDVAGCGEQLVQECPTLLVGADVVRGSSARRSLSAWYAQ